MYWLIKKGAVYSYTQTVSVRPKFAVQEWPEEIDVSDFPFCIISFDPELEQYNIALDQGAKDAAIALEIASSNLTDDYSLLQTDVMSKMSIAFNTTNEGSAIRQYLMFIRMSSRPEVYNNEGLRALNDVGYLVRGDNLDTTQKIQDYADGMLAVVDQFSIDAELEVIKFLDKKQAITGQW